MDVFLRIFISACAFCYQSSSAELNCSNNHRCRCTYLPDSSLKLDCSGLQLEQWPYIYDNVTFVDMSFNKISMFNEENIPSTVKYLDLSHNKIKYLNESSFGNASNMNHLDISHCDLRNIRSGTFRPLRQLSYLNISFNRFLTFRILENITYDLQSTKIKVLDISRLHCTFGPGIVIYIQDFKHLRKTPLQILHLNSNRISEIEKHALGYLPSTLKELYVKDNELSMGQYVLEIFLLRGLKVFDGSYQYTIHMPTAQTNQYHSCNDWRPPKGYCHSVLNDTKQMFSDSDFFSDSLSIVDFPLPLPQLLENSSFIGCGVKINIPEMVFAPGNSIKRVDLHDNTFYSWEGPVLNLKQLEYLDLSNNLCSYISDVFLSDATNLITLNISNNLLGFVLHKAKPFDFLHKLQNLYLSSNRINYLENDIFAKTTNLTILTLTSNQLKTWNFTINEMKKLMYIDLRNNNIQLISPIVRNEIFQAASTRNLKINLENNQMLCECSASFLEQLKWMRHIQRKYQTFIHFHNYKCSSNNGYVYLNDDEAVRKFEWDCGNYLGVIMGTLGIIVLCTSVLICGLIYRFRWKLRYLFYMKKNEILGQDRRQRSDSIYELDAFVSYAEEDSYFIRTCLLDELETKRDFRLCLHQRDFIAGKDIAENITNAIHSSRVTVAVVTPNYLKSYWCMFEFNMARMESIYARDGDDTIFLLFYKSVPTKSLPLNMLDLIDNKTYIEYPESDTEQNIGFWDVVAKSIAK